MFRVLFFICWISLFSEEAVTYELSGGRFGDNLVAYLHAKWLAHEKNIPLFYKPFPLSSKLKMDDEETHLFSSETKVLVCPYFAESKAEKSSYSQAFDVNWCDVAFREKALQMISPKKQLKLIHPPSDTINIALHVREGGGFDPKEARTQFPLKLPPLEFYIGTLKTVLSYFPNQSVYCRLFTDSRHPEKIARKIEASLPKGTRFYMNYRKKNSHHYNVLQDFFSLFNFDILIRPESNFSLVPSRLHDFAIVCSPLEIEIHPELFQELKRKKATAWPMLAAWSAMIEHTDRRNRSP